MPRVVVDVMLKPEILDPQGQAVANALPRLGVGDVASVRIGRRIEIEFTGEPDLDRAREIADKLLANPVIEDFTVRVVEADDDRGRPLVTARVGVVTFPGSLDDGDARPRRADRRRRAGPALARRPGLHGVDAVVLPGGFSYGDYLRCGAIARFAPVMETIVDAARGGLPVLGICNGFQILCEAHLLPGALTRNQHLHFRNRDQVLRVESAGDRLDQRASSPARRSSSRSRTARAATSPTTATLDELEAEGRVVARYVGGNPNGSQRDIAAITNDAGNVVGIMPHPEHAVEALTGPSLDGLGFFTSVLRHLVGAPA